MSILHRPRASKELDGYSLSLNPQTSVTDPAIALTLPFDPLYVRRDRTEQLLKRTAQRWVWFEEARKLDPTLGTLIYLPLEIRRRVWEMALQYNATLSADGLWESDHSNGSPLNLAAYYFGFGRRWFDQGRTMGLRLVSSSVRSEFEDIFLSKRTFRFNSPESLDAFVNHMSSYQLSRLRSFEIGLSVSLTTSLGAWPSFMARLPHGLQDIHLRIYPARNGWFGTPRGIRAEGNDREIGQEEFDRLDVLVKQAIQRAPSAGVTICGAAKEYQFSPSCQIVVDAILVHNRQHPCRLSQTYEYHPGPDLG